MKTISLVLKYLSAAVLLYGCFWLWIYFIAFAVQFATKQELLEQKWWQQEKPVLLP